MATNPINIKVAGKYVLVKKIGEGAFGEIYIAKSIEKNERVAVKLAYFCLFNDKIGKSQERA